MPTALTFEPYVADEDLVADLPDGRTVQVAAKGTLVTPQLLAELRVVRLPRRVDEPSQHSPEADLKAAAATTEAAAAGAIEPHNELQRRGVQPAAVQTRGIEADASGGEVLAEVRSADTTPSDDEESDADAEKKKTSPRPRTGAKPAPKDVTDA